MRRDKFQKIWDISTIIFIILLIISIDVSNARNISDYWSQDFSPNIINIRNNNGQLYAYIVLLFNENPHFVNLIQEDSISLKMMQEKNFHLNEYRRYINKIKKQNLKKMAQIMLKIYLDPIKFDSKSLKAIQKALTKYNIILRFSKVSLTNKNKVILDYCIYGNKEFVNIVHPLFKIKENIYNIQPFIYYDEFSTSNSTFYFDMIYINPEEVHNDYIIAKKILEGEKVDSMFFVGSRITDDIKYCIAKAFLNSKTIKAKILEMFEIHELTHKILNNHYNCSDQVTGEELALLSTIYSNTYLGLSVMYSYLNYNIINPHRIAAMNFIRFVSNKLGRFDIINNPSLLKHIHHSELKKFVLEHFTSIVHDLR
ncbi:MAG: hypothetical protein SVR08_16915 [Spirochaetota bacterium]|nr:hypothetical protein [Spirochaetota bacterium]